MDSLLVPSNSDVMLVGSEEELKLHVLARIAVFLHVRIEEIAGIVEGTHPFGIYADIVALETLRHRSRKENGVIELIVWSPPPFCDASVVAIDLELPLTREIDGGLSMD